MEKTHGNQDLMHGSIFALLRRFVEGTTGPDAWPGVLRAAGVEGGMYEPDGMYPTDDLFAVAHQAAGLLGVSVYELMERFGEYIVPDLIHMYRGYLDPGWRTYGMLLHTEERMHGAVRREDGRTDPPRLEVTRRGEDRLVIDYRSRRRMSGVAVGIIRGIARYYGEQDWVTVTRLSKPDAEAVQILVYFRQPPEGPARSVGRTGTT